jgi:hypothetical protein
MDVNIFYFKISKFDSSTPIFVTSVAAVNAKPYGIPKTRTPLSALTRSTAALSRKAPSLS